jgi:hypothetical protein
MRNESESYGYVQAIANLWKGSDAMPGIVVCGDLGSLWGLDTFAGGPHVGGTGGAGCPFPSDSFTLRLGALKAA